MAQTPRPIAALPATVSDLTLEQYDELFSALCKGCGNTVQPMNALEMNQFKKASLKQVVELHGLLAGSSTTKTELLKKLTGLHLYNPACSAMRTDKGTSNSQEAQNIVEALALGITAEDLVTLGWAAPSQEATLDFIKLNLSVVWPTAAHRQHCSKQGQVGAPPDHVAVLQASQSPTAEARAASARLQQAQKTAEPGLPMQGGSKDAQAAETEPRGKLSPSKPQSGQQHIPQGEAGRRGDGCDSGIRVNMLDHVDQTPGWHLHQCPDFGVSPGQSQVPSPTAKPYEEKQAVKCVLIGADCTQPSGTPNLLHQAPTPAQSHVPPPPEATVFVSQTKRPLMHQDKDAYLEQHGAPPTRRQHTEAQLNAQSGLGVSCQKPEADRWISLETQEGSLSEGEQVLKTHIQALKGYSYVSHDVLINADTRLLRRWILFPLQDNFTLEVKRSKYSLSAGLHIGRVVEKVIGHLDGSCSPDCTKTHSFHYVRTEASWQGMHKEIEISLDLHERTCQASTCALLRIPLLHLEDAWVLLKTGAAKQIQEMVDAAS